MARADERRDVAQAPDVDLSRLGDVLGLLANKWSVRVLEALCTGPRRFGEITRRLDGVARKVLAETLRAMERDGLVSRSTTGVRGTAVEYSITPLGATLRELLLALQEWAKVHMPEVEDARARFGAREPLDDNQPNDDERATSGGPP
jgi:DNA-binding HxlR family transcriptional regulator